LIRGDPPAPRTQSFETILSQGSGNNAASAKPSQSVRAWARGAHGWPDQITNVRIALGESFLLLCLAHNVLREARFRKNQKRISLTRRVEKKKPPSVSRQPGRLRKQAHLGSRKKKNKKISRPIAVSGHSRSAYASASRTHNLLAEISGGKNVKVSRLLVGGACRQILTQPISDGSRSESDFLIVRGSVFL